MAFPATKREKDMVRLVGATLMYLFALMSFGVGVWRSLWITLLVVLVMALPLAVRRLEQIAVLLFIVALVYWSDLLPMERWARGVVRVIDRWLA